MDCLALEKREEEDNDEEDCTPWIPRYPPGKTRTVGLRRISLLLYTRVRHFEKSWRYKAHGWPRFATAVYCPIKVAKTLWQGLHGQIQWGMLGG